MNFGDNIEDEWFLTWLLLHLTGSFPVSVRVWDSDGEFLLIEAAYSLPRWLKPEVAANRVWLHRGAVHLIPPATNPAGRGGGRGGRKRAGDERGEVQPLTTVDALKALRGNAIDTASTGVPIHEAIKTRLHNFPDRARELMHRASVVVPARLAYVLLKEPQLLAAAAEAFHYRDPYDAVAASRMEHFPPEDMIVASVQFSRCLYAQIALQTFSAPKGWPAGAPLHSSDDDANADKLAAAIALGVKITAGFEMLVDQRARGTKVGDRARLSADRVMQLAVEPIDVVALASLEIPAAQSDAWLREGPSKIEQELVLREKEVEEYQKRKAARRQQDPRGPADLETKEAPITNRQRSGREYDPSLLSSRMKQFVDTFSGLEGAEVPEDFVAFDEKRFLSELGHLLGGEDGGGVVPAWTQYAAPHAESESDDEGSSFYSDSNSGSEFEEDGGAGGRENRDLWETDTATDSDDAAVRAGVNDDDDDNNNERNKFMANYDEVLSQQLAGTTLEQSFVSQAMPGVEEGNRDVESSSALTPVDVDVNLVSSLLASYKEQGGLPGPASTLASLLGVKLPDPNALE